MGSTTLGGVLAALAPVAIAVVSSVAQTLVGRWLDRTGKRDGPPLRRRVIDGWGWVTIMAVVLAAVVVAVLVGSAVAWIVGGAVAVGYVVAVVWWGWRRMPLLTKEARDWLDAWLAGNGGWGGLSYRLESVGLAERTYTVQGLSRVDDLHARMSRDEPGSEVLTPDDLLARGVDVLVTGEAGVGKSTNLRHFGSAAARRFWAEATRRSAAVAAPLPGWLPVLLSARELADKSSVEEALGQAPPGMLSRAPAAGARWLVLVDAVDEVLNAGQRQQVWELLLEAVRGEGPRRFVITSRSVDSIRWRDLGYRDVAHYRLHPFTDEQLFTFATRHQTRRSKPNAAEQAETEKRADRFVHQVRRQGLLEVVRLPLLAKLAADMYFDHRSRDLPVRRVDLYEHSIVQWLNKFDDALENQVLHGVSERERNDVHNLLKRMDENYAGAAALGGRVAVLRAFLTELADVHIDKVRHETELGLLDTAAHLMNVGSAIGVPATRLAVGRVLEATGLIRDPYHDARFWHQTFGEYLAAPKAIDQNIDDVDHWGRLLDDPATRPGAVFAFHHLPADRQHSVVSELEGSPRHLRHAGILAAEGICATPAADRIVDSLWRSKPALGSNSSQGRQKHATWWDDAADLGALSSMSQRMRELCDDPDAPFADRVNAAAVLARHGDDECRARLDLWASADLRDFSERTFVAEALARVDRDRGLAALLKLADDTSLDEFARTDLAEAMARIDRERGVSALAAVTGNAALSALNRLHAAEALAGFDVERGLTILSAMTRETVLGERYRQRAMTLLAMVIAERGESAWTKLDPSDSATAVKALEMLIGDVSLKPELRARAAWSLTHNDVKRGSDALKMLLRTRAMTADDRETADREVTTGTSADSAVEEAP